MQDEFNKLSAEVNLYMRKGLYENIVPLLEQMAQILRDEQKHADELRMLMFAFHIVLETKAKIEAECAERMRKIICDDKFNEWEIEDLYFEVAVCGGPLTLFSQNESFDIFWNYIIGEREKASVIIDNVLQNHL